ncbi:hypothetical protein E0Z10_g10338 [Xylaria hypoxylon]|uniref:Uncharacterized protein n=1 Tax=Xylaria hypoxylon TaxID=37992 RepID=A0A4Z0YEX5_9PEZI|nr:hypothetical protein E0Z10_g10338 [Xylaria hypoxylon]
MDTKFESHRQKRKAGPYSNDFIDIQDDVAVFEITIPELHKPLAAVIADNGGSDHLSGDIETIHDDERIDVTMGIELEAADNTLSDASIRRSSQSSISPLEDSASHQKHDSRECRRRSSDNNLVPDLPQADWEGSSQICHQTSLRIKRAPSRTNRLPSRGAETFMNLCDAITRFLAALSKQELSPFKTYPSRLQDKASNRARSPSNRNNTAGIHNLDRQLTPDHFSMSRIVCTTGSDSAPTVTDQCPSRDKEWEAHRERISNMLIRLLQWKDEFSEGDLQDLLSGMSPTAAAGEQAVKSLLLSIGEKLSDLVEYQIDKPRMNERFLQADRKLNDYIQRGKEAQCYSRSRDDASSTSSEGTIVSDAELARAINQQLDELDGDLDSLINMRIPTLLKKPIYRRRSRLRKNSVTMSSLYEPWDGKFHANSGNLSTPVTPMASLSTWGVVRPHRRPGSGRSLLSELSEHNLSDQLTSYSRKMRKTKETDQWASTQEILERIRLYWRHRRPPLDLEHQLHRNKSLHLTIAISSDPAVFQADKLRESLASLEQSRREPINSLTTLFSNLRIRPVDNKLCADIIQTFRDAVPKLHHEPNFETTGPFLESVESIDFTMALLDSLPHWQLYNNFPHGKELAKALGVSVQMVLLDEFWDSCANLLSHVRDTPPSLDHDTESQQAKQRYVQNLLLQRVRRLDSLRVNRALIEVWSSLQPMVHELVSELQDCTAMPKLETETEKQPLSLPISPDPTVFLRPPRVSIMPVQPQSKHQFRYKPSRHRFYKVPKPTGLPSMIQNESLLGVPQRRGSPNLIQQSPERNSTLVTHRDEFQGFFQQCSRFPTSHHQTFDKPLNPSIIRHEDSPTRPTSPSVICRDEVPRNAEGRALSPPLSPTSVWYERTEFPLNYPSRPVAPASLPPPSKCSDRLGSTSTFHGPSNIVPGIKVPGPVLLPPAYLLCYTVPTPGNDLSRSSSPLRRGSTASTASVGEEATELGTSFCTIQLGDEFINCTNTVWTDTEASTGIIDSHTST